MSKKQYGTRVYFGYSSSFSEDDGINEDYPSKTEQKQATRKIGIKGGTVRKNRETNTIRTSPLEFEY